MSDVWVRMGNVRGKDKGRKEEVHGCAPDADCGVEVCEEEAVEEGDVRGCGLRHSCEIFDRCDSVGLVPDRKFLAWNA